MHKTLSYIIQPLIVIAVISLVLYKGIAYRSETVQGIAPNDFTELFTVVVESGDVYYQQPKSVDFVRIAENEVNLPNKSIIKSDDGIAHIILPDNSVISLDKFTTIEVNIQAEATNIKQLYGNTWHRIKELSKLGEYTVETDNTIAAVRGTEFGVNVTENLETSVYVVESIVDVSKYEDKNTHKEILDTQRVTANKMVRINPNDNSKLEVTDIPDVFKKTIWFTKNKSLERVTSLRSKTEMRDYIKQVRAEIDKTNTLGSSTSNEDETPPTPNLPGNTVNTPASTVVQAVLNKITEIKKKLIDPDPDEEEDETEISFPESIVNENNDTKITQGASSCEAEVVFQIGDSEESNTSIPFDELNWTGNYEVLPNYANPYVVGKNSPAEFPWTSQKIYANEIELSFDIPEKHKDSIIEVSFSWAPGLGGAHSKEVFIDGKSLGVTSSKLGKISNNWYGNFEFFTEEGLFKTNLNAGTHTLKIKSNQDISLWEHGSYWNWLKVAVVDANCVEPTPDPDPDTDGDTDPIEPGTVFMIGEKEEFVNGKWTNPADELNWDGVSPLIPMKNISCIVSNSSPTGCPPKFADPFWTFPHDSGDLIVNANSAKDFPWNSNPSYGPYFNVVFGYASNVNVNFKVENSKDIPVRLSFSWSPGASLNEYKEIFLNGALLGKTAVREGKFESAYFEGWKTYTETFCFALPELPDTGYHSIVFKHDQKGNGSVWDWVKLEVISDIENCIEPNIAIKVE